MKSAQPPSITIRQIEYELEKAEPGMALPYDTERDRPGARPIGKPQGTPGRRKRGTGVLATV